MKVGAGGSTLSLDLYIAAMGRSGSTALANMMTSLPERQVLVEPSAAAFGHTSWDLVQSELDQENFIDTCNSLRTSLLFGIKEVDPRSHAAVGRLLKPAIIILLVRNIRDVYLSYVEKHQKQKSSDVFDKKWVVLYCVTAAEALVDLAADHSKNLITLHYESFFWSEREKAALEQNTSWTLNGDPFVNFDRYERMYEVERNSKARKAHLDPLARGLHSIEIESADQIAEICLEYQRTFGYV